MSSQTISRAVVQGPAKVALGMSVCGTAPWALFTALGLGHMGSLLTVGSLLLFVVMGVITGALAATSLCLWRAAQRLPPTRLSPQTVAQEERKTWRRFVVAGVAALAILLADFSLTPHHGELVYPVLGLIFGIGLLLVALLRCPARYVPVQWHYLGGGAFTLLSVVAVLALLFGMTLGEAYIWTVIVSLGYIVIFWLTALSQLSEGEQLLHQGTAMSSSPGQNYGYCSANCHTTGAR